ncbi:MAG: MliC family protein [Caldimonas sp.]
MNEVETMWGSGGRMPALAERAIGRDDGGARRGRRAGVVGTARALRIATAFVVAVTAVDRVGAAERSAIDCSKVATGSVASLVCRDATLSRLDNQLARVFSSSLLRAAHERPPMLKGEQRRWLKTRDECGKSNDIRACVELAYRRRTAELQARYRLVPGKGPVTYVCNGDDRDQVIATYFRTNPPTLIAERGDKVSLMFLERSGSGARYRGRDASLWEHQREASIQWGADASEMHCFLKR